MAAILNPTAHSAPCISEPTAPWNRAGILASQPGRRHLRLVGAASPAITGPDAARRGPVATVVSGLALAVLVALAAIGLLQFLGADAAASTPASTTGLTDPVAVDASVASAATAVEPESVVTEAPAGPTEMVVQPGDSLWAVAHRLQPHGDVRHLVDRLIERNGGATVSVGQHLDVRGLLG
jgi:hypothetical protein